MAKEEKITLDAEVIEALPDARFKVKLENGHEIPYTHTCSSTFSQVVLYLRLCHPNSFLVVNNGF